MARSCTSFSHRPVFHACRTPSGGKAAGATCRAVGAHDPNGRTRAPHRQPQTACRAGAARWRSFNRRARTASRLRQAGVAVTGPVRPHPMPAGRPNARAPAARVLGHLRAPALGGYMPGGRGIARIGIRREAEQEAVSTGPAMRGGAGIGLDPPYLSVGPHPRAAAVRASWPAAAKGFIGRHAPPENVA